MKLDEIIKDETLHPPSISVGDEVKVGKWKNRKAIVKGFTKDDHGQPVLKTTKGDQKLYKPRVSKLEPEKKKLDEISDKEKFKAILRDPNFEDALDKFKQFKSLVSEYDVKVKYSYNSFIPVFVIKVITPYKRNADAVISINLMFKAISLIIMRMYADYDVWSSAASSELGHFKIKKNRATIDYNIYTSSKSEGAST